MKKFSANISARLRGARKSSKATDLSYATLSIKLSDASDHYKPGDEIKGRENCSVWKNNQFL